MKDLTFEYPNFWPVIDFIFDNLYKLVHLRIRYMLVNVESAKYA